jgi:putative membrane protein
MRLCRLTAAMGAALVVTGCYGTGTGRTATVENDMFLSAALAHAQSELELAQLAQEKAHTRSIVAYAQRVAAERAPLVDWLATAAKTNGTSADTDHTPAADAFKPLEGEAFERAYVASQIEDEQNAVDLFDFASRTSSNQAVKQFAADALPGLRQDLADAIGVVKDIPFESVSDKSDDMIVLPRSRR